MSIRERIVDFINSDDYKPLLKEELLIKFDMDSNFKKEFYKILDSLEKEGLIYKTSNERYVSTENEYFVTGILEGNERGYGFVVPLDKEQDDIFIPAEYMEGAMHKDKVLVTITKGKEEDKRQEGKVIKILERNTTTIVGTFEMSKNFGFVIPDNPKIYYDVFIPKAMIFGARNNQKVVVEITKWPSFRKNPEGKVIEVLGYSSDKGTDILSVIREFDLPEEFPDNVINYVKDIKSEVTEEELVGRVDLRDINTFTIDGPDAKDLDDAISIKRLENGNFELGVHIADVAHYVTENTPLDKEAYKRGNSVYLIDRVVPMLPKELSNGICSLNEGVDRLTLSVIMEINKNGDVMKHKVLESVINSNKRLVYDDVSDYIESGFKDHSESIEGLLDEVQLMNELKEILYDKRQRRGSINFDFPETKITLNEDGVPIDISKEERRVANQIIEEFMLITNETVAEEYFWAEIPFLYRIHEEPSSEKITTFARFVHNLGYNLKGKEVHPKELQLLIEEIKGKKEEIVISTLLLRSLKKAKYSEQPEMHFGLASQHYSHFTAPIRRYSDLVIHRIIKENLKGKLSLKRQENLNERLPEIADHTSMTERRAEEAEREVEDLKKTQYMVSKVGNEYEGIISSLTNFGIFVQLENTIEGLVHFNDMSDDYYHFDEENYVIIGERSKKTYSLGDPIKVQVTAANIKKRAIDFRIVK